MYTIRMGVEWFMHGVGLHLNCNHVRLSLGSTNITQTINTVIDIFVETLR